MSQINLKQQLEQEQKGRDPIGSTQTEHWAGLQTARAADPDIWDLPALHVGCAFSTISRCHAGASKPHCVCSDRSQRTGEKVVGMTSYINPDTHGVVEIGGTYIEPSMRGTGFNDEMKKL